MRGGSCFCRAMQALLHEKFVNFLRNICKKCLKGIDSGAKLR